MYDMMYLNVTQMCAYLGVGRNTVLRLCQDRVHGFPAVKVGNRWQADAAMLNEWRQRWFAGEFDINS